MPSPWFVTTMVNAATSPALIVPLSAVLTTDRSGHWTVIEAELWLSPLLLSGSLAASTVAVLGS